MPAAYDTSSRRFDELMAEVCPGAVAEIYARIDKLRSDWDSNDPLAPLKAFVEEREQACAEAEQRFLAKYALLRNAAC